MPCGRPGVDGIRFTVNSTKCLPAGSTTNPRRQGPVDDRESDWGNTRIQKFDNDGNFVAAWNTGWGQPRRIAVAPDGSVFVIGDVVASFDQHIEKFDNDGTFLTSWMLGTDSTAGLAIDPTGRLFVGPNSGSGHATLYVFDESGSPL